MRYDKLPTLHHSRYWVSQRCWAIVRLTNGMTFIDQQPLAATLLRGWLATTAVSLAGQQKASVRYSVRNGFLHYRTGNHLYPDWAEKGKRKVMIFFNRRIHTTFLWNADTSSEAKDFGKLFISHISPYFSQTVFTFPGRYSWGAWWCTVGDSTVS